MKPKKKLGKGKRLPRKASALLRLTVSDCLAVEQLRDYELCMRTFHYYARAAGKCCVCMAGAVMARTLKTPIKSFIFPENFTPTLALRLQAIDSLRNGYGAGLVPQGHPALALITAAYDDNLDRAPWHTYLQAADMLEADGL